MDGRDYHFMDRPDFEARLRAGDFLEHALVHGNFYGSLKSEVVGHLEAGVDVVMDIDVQGAAQIRDSSDPVIRRAMVDLFVIPSGEDELRARLSGRGTDAEDVISLRMANALDEMKHWPLYTYLMISSTREEDYSRLLALVNTERLRSSRIRS
jgi:guanylate kinase